MLEKVASFKTSSGKTFENLADAQAEELKALLKVEQPTIIEAIISNADKIVDILTTKAGSHLKARKNRKARTPKPEPEKP